MAGLNALDYLALVVLGVNTLRFGSQEGFEELANRRFLCFSENLIIYGNFTYPIFFFFLKKRRLVILKYVKSLLYFNFFLYLDT